MYLIFNRRVLHTHTYIYIYTYTHTHTHKLVGFIQSILHLVDDNIVYMSDFEVIQMLDDSELFILDIIFCNTCIIGI